MNDRQLIANLDGYLAQAESNPAGGRRRRTALKNARAFAAEAERRGLGANVDRLRLQRLSSRTPAALDPDENDGGWIFGHKEMR